MESISLVLEVLWLLVGVFIAVMLFAIWQAIRGRTQSTTGLTVIMSSFAKKMEVYNREFGKVMKELSAVSGELRTNATSLSHLPKDMAKALSDKLKDNGAQS